MRPILLAIVVAGCSTGGSSAEGTVNGQPMAGTSTVTGGTGASVDVCREDCETFANCQGFPLSGCAGSISCGGWPSDLWRKEVLTAYQNCQRTCPADPETCIQAAFAAAGDPRAIDSEYSSACAAKTTECERSGLVTLDNNTCGDESLYVDSAVAKALACLTDAQPDCIGIGSCVDEAFDQD